MSDLLNPYKTPDVVEPNVPRALLPHEQELASMEQRLLKKIYVRSHILNAFVIIILFLSSVLVLGLLLSLFTTRTDVSFNLVSIIAITVCLCCTAIGLYRRSRWGRRLGVITCVLMIMSWHPLAIIAALFGFFALSGAPRLFGDHRFTHLQLLHEVTYRQILTKSAKRKKRMAKSQ